MENELSVIIQESGLDKTKAQYILENFQGYFAIASEWETKAKSIVITNENQITEMKMAREARLFLREKRIAIEKARKELKEQSLREGKAIDGISNVLKALIEPIEEYLESQEKFIEIQEAKKAELLRIEVEKKIEEERIAKEKAEAEERERIKLENEQLKAEAIKREKEQEAELAKERAKIEAELKAKAEAERLALEAKEKAEEELRQMIECPNCHKKFKLA